MSDYLQLDDYIAALEEATRLIGRSPAPASPEDERLDVLLHRIATFPPAFISEQTGDSSSGALLAQLRADVEAFVRKRATRCANRPFPIREHGVGRTL